MSRITYIPNRVIDQNGIADGASVFVYLAGTTTPIPIFLDEGLTVPATNPYVVAAGAAVPPLFHGQTGAIRVRVVSLAGLVIQDDDPYNQIITSGDLSSLDPSGASQVFLSTGLTVEQKLSEFVSISDYGAVGDNVTDDTQAFLDALSDIEASGGGVLRLAPGLTYRVTAQLTITGGIKLDMNGSKIRSELSGSNEAGVVLYSNTSVENGHIEVDSLGSPGSSAGAHAPIRIGAIPSDAGTVANPDPGENATSWVIRNMILESDKLVGGNGAPGVQIYGGANNGLIETITIPDNSRMAAAVMMDWSFLGSLSSEATLSNMNNNKTNFNAGTAYTTHPNNIVVRNVRCGVLSATATGAVDVGSWVVRLSGVYNVTVENVVAKSCTYRAFLHTAGDLGFEFAPASVKPFACKNVVFRDCIVEDGSTAYLAFSDSLADNVQTAVGLGYVSLMDPFHETNILFEGIVGKGIGAGANYGIRILQQRGGVIRDVDVSYYKQGINVDENVYGLTIERAHCHFNREDGIHIHHGTNLPVDVVVRDVHVHDNGQDVSGYSVSSGLYIGGSRRVTVERGRFGRSGAFDPTQQIGIRVVAGAVDTVISNPHIRSARSADGFGLIILGSSSFNLMGLVEGVRYDTAYLNTKYSGLECVPFKRTVFGSGGNVLTEYVTNASNTLIGLVVTAGDRIWFGDPTSGAAPGRVAVSSGTVDAGNLNTLTKTMAVLA